MNDADVQKQVRSVHDSVFDLRIALIRSKMTQIFFCFGIKCLV